MRSSAITLPSFGSVPGATSFTAPLSLVTDCKVAATAVCKRGVGAAHLRQQRHGVLLGLAVDHEPQRARARGWRAATSAICLGCTNMPLTLAVWSARPIQPLMRTLVRPHGETPGMQRGEIAGGEPDHRIIAD